jgi:lipoate-protein ligase A
VILDDGWVIPTKASMLLKFFFSRLSIEKQVSYLKKKGIALGTRLKGGRKIYIYMLSDLFVEVFYKNDNSDETPEKLNTLRGLNNLNEYLEKEFRTNF